MKKLLVIALALSVAACAQSDKGVRISAEKPVTKAATPKAVSRSEPVFYNGKTYRVNLTPASNGVYDVAVKGMSGTQKNDATAVATSSVRYFGCPDGKTGKLSNVPVYRDGNWIMSARCG